MAPLMAASIDGLDLGVIGSPGGRTWWCQCVNEAGRPFPPGAQRVAQAWIKDGAEVELATVPVEPFWATSEIVESVKMVEATSGFVRRISH